MHMKRLAVVALSLCALSGCYSAPYSPDTGYMQAPMQPATTTTERTTTVQQPGGFLQPGSSTTTTTVQQTRP